MFFVIMKFYGIQQEIKNLKAMINHLAGGSFAPEMAAHAEHSFPDLTIEPNDHAYQITRPVRSPEEAEPEFDDSVEVDDAGRPVSAPEPSASQEDAEELTLAGIEKKAIIRSLRRHHGNRKQAAEELGISDRTLYRKIEEYGLKDLGLVDWRISLVDWRISLGDWGMVDCGILSSNHYQPLTTIH